MLAQAYGNGLGVPKDEARSVPLMQKACQLHNDEACSRLKQACDKIRGASPKVLSASPFLEAISRVCNHP